MITKLFEVRDRSTFIPCLAVRMDLTDAAGPEETFLLRRAGYGPEPCTFFGKLEGGKFACDPYDHTQARTLQVAHDYVDKHWHELASGDVIDVEYIVGESKRAKCSERAENAL